MTTALKQVVVKTARKKNFSGKLPQLLVSEKEAFPVPLEQEVGI